MERVTEKVRRGFASRNEGVTLFVFNLPEKLHWKGMWFLFSYHGDVVDAYIPNKRSKGGHRFGFVRYASMEDALRAQERLDGFLIYSYRVRVHLARFDPCRDRGKRRESSRFQNTESEIGLTTEKTRGLKSVVGVIDPAKSEILNNCLVGWCNKFQRGGKLAKKLHKEGIKDVSIMRLQGSAFLLVFQNHEIVVSFKKDYELALKKWFSNIQVWSEEISVCNRRAWISCQGIPIHAWSEETFENIAALWGDLISIDERTFKPGSFQKAKFQILTNFSDCINETVELKVASKVYKIRVKEFEPSFTPNSVWCEDVDDSEHIESDDFNGNQKLNEDLEGQEEGSSSSKMNLEGEKLERSEGGGKILKGDVEIQLASDGCSVGLKNREERERVTPFIRTSRGFWPTNCFEGLGNAPPVEDIRMMGLEPLEFESENASVTVLHDVVPTTQVRECDDALVKGTAVDQLKKVKCIYDYDDEVTTKLRRNLESNVLKRKKGNYGKNKNKAGKEKLSTSKLDSDFSKHKEFLYKEARAVLEVGKKVGMRIIGNEEDVIEELVQEDLKKLDRR
ncbi:hypothetical protein GQ457_06G007350 [Hibiscus cannabinus]